MVVVMLVGAGGVEYGVLRWVAGEAGERFPGGVRFVAPLWREALPLGLFDAGRMQWRAWEVNRWLAWRYRGWVSRGGLLVAVVEGDGYVEGLNFVFGLADPGLGVASVYTRRLRLGAGPGLFRGRLLKVVVHETGHLLGLGHCGSPGCVMRFSNSLGELDAKGDRFCPRCMERLRRLLGG